MSAAILVANFPTLVPPYFCTSHFESGSILFWCRLGGVEGREDGGDDAGESEGVLSDIAAGGGGEAWGVCYL